MITRMQPIQLNGFNTEVIEELCKTTETLKSFQQFADLEDPEKNLTFDNEDDLAAHVMANYIHGLASDLKFVLGYVATRNNLFISNHVHILGSDFNFGIHL